MLRRLALAIAAALIVLVAIVAVRTAMVPSLTSDVPSPPVAAQIDADTVAKHLAEAVRFQTVSWEPGTPAAKISASQAQLVALRDWIGKTYPAFSARAEREIVSDYSLLFTWRGSDASLKPALFMSHLDVVPVAPGSESMWTHPPFDGVIADGHVWGRGSMDTKIGFVAMLEAAEAMIAKGIQPKRTIMLALGHDEELGGRKGNSAIAALLKSRGIRLAMVNDEGGAIAHGVVSGVDAPVAVVGVAEKGSVTLELTASATGGHSSMPPAVRETAIGRLAHGIETLDGAPFESRVDGITAEFMRQLLPVMPLAQRAVVANLWLTEPLVLLTAARSPSLAASLHTTIAPTIIQGGNKANVMPPDAKAWVNFRIHPRDTIESVVAHVTAAIDDKDIRVTVMPGARGASNTSSFTGPAFDLMRRTIRRLNPEVVVVPSLVNAGTDSRYYEDLSDSVFRFLPFEVHAADLKRIHGNDERMPIKTLGRAADFYVDLFSGLDTLP